MTDERDLASKSEPATPASVEPQPYGPGNRQCPAQDPAGLDCAGPASHPDGSDHANANGSWPADGTSGLDEDVLALPIHPVAGQRWYAQLEQDARNRRTLRHIGATIRLLRRNLGMTQKDLGDKVGVSNAAIGQFESARTTPGVATVANLAEALGVGIGVLFGDPLSTAEHLVSQVRAEVRGLGYDVILVHRGSQ